MDSIYDVPLKMHDIYEVLHKIYYSQAEGCKKFEYEYDPIDDMRACYNCAYRSSYDCPDFDLGDDDC